MPAAARLGMVLGAGLGFRVSVLRVHHKVSGPRVAGEASGYLRPGRACVGRFDSGLVSVFGTGDDVALKRMV